MLHDSRLIHNQFDSQANRGAFLYLTPLNSNSCFHYINYWVINYWVNSQMCFTYYEDKQNHNFLKIK